MTYLVDAANKEVMTRRPSPIDKPIEPSLGKSRTQSGDYRKSMD